MTTEIQTLHTNYIQNHLVTDILEKLQDEQLISIEVQHAGGLDGFMSALYSIDLKTKEQNGSIRERYLIAKFMKGDADFRESTKSYIQFPNEIYIYQTVIPEYEKVLNEAKLTDLSTENWVPRCYVAKFGYVEGMSSSNSTQESVLVLENLKTQGFMLGERVYLSLDQLYAMSHTIAEYHAMSYVLRLSKPALLERLSRGVLPLSFLEPSTEEKGIGSLMLGIAFERFYEYLDRLQVEGKFDRNNEQDRRFLERMAYMREKFYEQPTQLMEQLVTIGEREEDQRFAAILHGDYNRNNVLFRMKQNPMAPEEEAEQVEGMRMFDFQELRFGSPAIDLSFFMYFNCTKDIREQHWMDLLKAYHSKLFETLSRVLKANKTAEEQKAIDKQLKLYAFPHFLAHHERFALYGVMIALHFLPWLLCSEEECLSISKLFETDAYGEEFRKISLKAGGDAVNEVLLGIVRHACQMGYMDHI